MCEFTFKIIRKIGVLSTSEKGWEKHLNLISWKDRDPKLEYSQRRTAKLPYQHLLVCNGVILLGKEVVR
jgi:hypothetical protein